ncbi:MAG: hypothetical protein NT157_00275 [Candidatus Micrarchaeota archaeon]|nr:hypothetical protein [Candidatus Micrarchaeota archaeon]
MTKILYLIASIIAIPTIFSLLNIGLKVMDCGHNATPECAKDVTEITMQFIVSEITFWPNLIAGVASVPVIGPFLAIGVILVFALLVKEGLA